MRRHAVWIVPLMLCAVVLTVAGAASSPRETVYFDDSGSDLLVGNSAYEIALQKRDGGLISIVDKATGQTVSNGSLNRCLWVVVFPEEVPQPVVESCEFYPGGADAFQYEWSPAAGQLTLSYTPDSAGSNRVPATVTLSASEDNWFDLQLALTNQKGAVPKEVKFPSDLVFDRYGISEALLPVLPGVVLDDGFFSRGVRFEENYPGTHFADFVALRQGAAVLAMYAVAGSDPVAPVFFGFTFDSCADTGSVCLTHNYNSGVAGGDAWTSPRYRFRLNEDFPTAIASFRQDNGIDAFDPVETKLGALYDQVVRLPTYKMDLGSGYGPGHGIPFSELADLLDTLPYPGILHLVAYWPRGFDENYPDFLPPDPDLGTQQELADAMENARARGHLVMPYIKPVWWDHDSPTVQNLPPPLTLEDIAVLDREGNVVEAWYGTHHGFFASPHAPFVRERLDQLLEDLSQAIPSDLIHEDQVGGLWSIPDFNPAAPDSASYARAWLDHTRQYRDLLLTTEKGYDRLAETVTGFHGSTVLEQEAGITDYSGDRISLLWHLHGNENNCDRAHS